MCGDRGLTFRVRFWAVWGVDCCCFMVVLGAVDHFLPWCGSFRAVGGLVGWGLVLGVV